MKFAAIITGLIFAMPAVLGAALPSTGSPNDPSLVIARDLGDITRSAVYDEINTISLGTEGHIYRFSSKLAKQLHSKWSHLNWVVVWVSLPLRLSGFGEHGTDYESWSTDYYTRKGMNDSFPFTIYGFKSGVIEFLTEPFYEWDIPYYGEFSFDGEGSFSSDNRTVTFFEN